MCTVAPCFCFVDVCTFNTTIDIHIVLCPATDQVIQIFIVVFLSSVRSYYIYRVPTSDTSVFSYQSIDQSVPFLFIPQLIVWPHIAFGSCPLPFQLKSPCKFGLTTPDPTQLLRLGLSGNLLSSGFFKGTLLLFETHEQPSSFLYFYL